MVSPLASSVAAQTWPCRIRLDVKFTLRKNRRHDSHSMFPLVETSGSSCFEVSLKLGCFEYSVVCVGTLDQE